MVGMQVVNDLTDLVTFAEKNRNLITYLLSSDVSKIVVECQNKWINYRKLESSRPDVYEFVTAKFNLKDCDIIGVQALVANLVDKNLPMTQKAEKVTYVTDYVCNLFLNQTTTGYDKFFAAEDVHVSK